MPQTSAGLSRSPLNGPRPQRVHNAQFELPSGTLHHFRIYGANRKNVPASVPMFCFYITGAPSPAREDEADRSPTMRKSRQAAGSNPAPVPAAAPAIGLS